MSMETYILKGDSEKGTIRHYRIQGAHGEILMRYDALTRRCMIGRESRRLFITMNRHRQDLRAILSTAQKVEDVHEISIPFTFSSPVEQPTIDTRYKIFCDGSCDNNGKGGWAFIIVENNRPVSEMAGYEEPTNSNRMELKAALQALLRIAPHTPVSLYTDSQYVVKGVGRWLGNWRHNGYFTALNRPVRNADLWMSLGDYRSEKNIYCNWIPSGDIGPWHRRSHLLAQRARR